MFLILHNMYFDDEKKTKVRIKEVLNTLFCIKRETNTSCLDEYNIVESAIYYLFLVIK